MPLEQCSVSRMHVGDMKAICCTISLYVKY